MDRLASLSYCELCPAGKVVPLNWFTLTGTAAITSSLREVACIDCEAGKSRALAQLDTVCTTCSSGRYAGGGAAQCHQCPLGLRTDINTSGATECISCPAGSQTNAEQTDCEQCQAHESSAFGGCQTCTPGKEPNEEGLRQQEAALTNMFDSQASAFYTSGHLLDDGMIDPRDSRKTLGFLLETVWETRHRTVRPNSFGIARM